MSGKAGSKPVLLAELTSDGFAKIVKRKPLVIVPFGSVEEHGSHLPLCTDAFQAEEVARRQVAALKLGAMKAAEKNPRLKIMVLSDYELAYELLVKKFPKDDGHRGEIE